MTALLNRLCNVFKKTNPSRFATSRRVGLEVTSLEDRLTPSTLFVNLPVIEDEAGFYGRQIEVFETGGEIIVTLNNGIQTQNVIRVNAAGYNHIDIQGTSYKETFIMRGQGISLTLRESSNDDIFLVGNDSNSLAVPGGHDFILIGNTYSGMNGRMVYYTGIANNIFVHGLDGDNTIKIATTQIPVHAATYDGNDTFIVQNTATRTALMDTSGSSVAVLIHGGGGNNVYAIGAVNPLSSDPQNLNSSYSMDLLRGPIAIRTDSLTDKLHIFDKADMTANQYTLTDTLFTRNSFRIHHEKMSQIILHAGKGNDLIQASGVTSKLTLNGNAGNDMIVGGVHNDELNGGEGHDILIGGNGLDKLFGGSGDDVVFGGVLSFASDNSRLNSLRTTWTTFSNSYETRVSQLRSTFSTSVREDFVRDELWGESGVDWFWGSSYEVKDLQQVWMYVLSPLGGWISFYYQELNR